MQLKKPLHLIFSFIFPIIIGYFIFRYLNQNWNESLPFKFQIKLPYLLILGLIILTGNFSLSIFGWKIILHKLGEDLPFRKCLSIVTKSQLTKYLPGYVFPYISRVYLSGKERLDGAKVLSSIYLEKLLTIASGITISFFAFFFYPSLNPESRIGIYLIAAGLALSFFALHPKVLNMIAGLFSKLFRRERLMINIGSRDILPLFLVYVLIWIGYGVGNFLVISALYPLKMNYMLAVIGIASFSWVIGFLAFMVPVGLGVREGIAIPLLSLFIPLKVALAAVLIVRISLTISELGYMGIVFLLDKRIKVFNDEHKI